MSKGINRRDFFKVAAVSGAAAAVAGCGSDPVENLIPLVVPPHDYVPGTSIHFSTTCGDCSANCGLVIKTREGRAIKVEGNPDHPISGGSVCASGQASLQALYSPARPNAVLLDGKASNFDDGIKTLIAKITEAKGSVLYVGAPRTGSISKLIDQVVDAAGGKRITFDMSPDASIKKANELTFGKAEVPHYAIDQAKTLVSFGADFMDSWLMPNTFSRAYTKMHAFKAGEKGKYFYVGSHMSLTGTNADSWISTPAGAEIQIALAVANAINTDSKLNDYLADFSIAAVTERLELNEAMVAKVNALVEAFKAGDSLAIAGGNTTANGASTELQIAVNVLNSVAGNIGNTVQFGAGYQLGGDSVADAISAFKAAAAGTYKVIIIENVNPLYALPADAGVAEALKAAFVVSLSTEQDETAKAANLHLPTSHFYESWGDAMPRTGVSSLFQPVMAKVPGKPSIELGDLLLKLAPELEVDAGAETAQEYVKAQWATKLEGVFEDAWIAALSKGGIFAEFTGTGADLNTDALETPATAVNAGLTLVAVNSVLHNANGFNGSKSWALEVAHPVTQQVWDSWIEIHPDTAVKMGIKQGEVIQVTGPGGTVEVGAWLWYGMDKNTVAMPAGLGRSVPFPTYATTHGKSILTPVVEMADDVQLGFFKAGINVMDVLSAKTDAKSGDMVFAVNGVTLKGTGKEAYMVSPEGVTKDDIEAIMSDTKAGMGDRSQKDRGLVQTIDFKTAKAGGKGEGHGHHLRHRHYTTDLENNVDFYKERSADVADAVALSGRKGPKYFEPYKWEMAVDLDRCTGCSACVVACYAENNVPTVGKDRMATGREMNWIRIERYIDHNKETGDPETYYTPEMCSQCDNAGCEPVCPVYATYQNDEGINAMIYNRCVGTRYCANNCIYKQRRYNWRDYTWPNPLNLQLNPAITVRGKGVMEKCNFCFSRIREFKDLAKDQGRVVRDGEIQTACQQTCPTDAITFGNIKDKSAAVTQLKESTKRGYLQFEEVNYKPVITYLKKVKHENSKA